MSNKPLFDSIQEARKSIKKACESKTLVALTLGYHDNGAVSLPLKFHTQALVFNLCGLCVCVYACVGVWVFMKLGTDRRTESGDHSQEIEDQNQEITAVLFLEVI